MRSLLIVLRSGIFVVLTLLIWRVADAHLVKPKIIILTGLGDTATFTVADSGSCSALISVSSTDVGVVSINPPDVIDAVSHTFTIKSEVGAHATANIVVQWVGEDVGGEGPCQDQAGDLVFVQVVPKVRSTAETTAPPLLPEDPVNSSTGELFLPVVADLDLGGILPVRLERYYASELERDGMATGTLGNNWRHSFDWTLTDYVNRVQIVSPRGQSILFEDSIDGLPQGDWVLKDDTEVPFQLAGQEFGFEFTMLDPRTRLLYVFDNPFAEGETVRVKRIEDGKGNVLTVTSGASGVNSVTDGLGRALTFGYTSGKLTSLSDGTRNVSYAYDGDNLVSFTDARAEVWTYTYDDTNAVDGLLTSVATPRGTTRMTATWDSQGRVATQTLAGTSTTTLTYGSDMTTGTQPIGQPVQHTFDQDLLLQTVTDEEGNQISITHDSDGRRNSLLNEDGDLSAVTYDPASGLPVQIVDYDGATTGLTYETRTHSSGVVFYDLIQVDHPDGTSDTFDYDANGNVISTTNRLGATYTATYGPRAEVLTVTLPTMGVFATTYNADKTPATFTNPAGETIAFGYDALRRRTSVTYSDVDASTRLYEYDTRDAITKYTDQEGRETLYTYDENGNAASATTPRGEVTTFTYDALDRVVSSTAPNGSVVFRTYDVLGRIDSQTDRNGNVMQLTRDGRGATTMITDPDGNNWSRSYSPAGYVQSETDPLGNTVQYETNEVGLLTKVTSPLGHETLWSYGQYNELEKITSPLGPAWDYDYRSNQQPNQIAVGDNTAVTSWTYSDLERVEVLTDPIGETWIQSHDNQGRLQSFTDPLGRSTLYARDMTNRTETLTFPGGMGTLVTEFNRDWQLSRRTFSDATVIDYGYDANGDLNSATGLTLESDLQRLVSRSNGIDIGRDPGGNVTSVTYALNREVTYTYDSGNRPVSVTDWIGGTTTLAYDAEGKITNIVRPNGVETTFTWDADGRLIGVHEELGAGTISDIELSRDGRGQITGAVRNVPSDTGVRPGIELYSYDAASQEASLQYDSLGRVTQKDGDSYTWDLAGRLTSYTRQGNTVDFEYDGLGQPISRTESGVTRNWIWNYAMSLPVLAIEREASADVTYHVTLPGGGLLYSIDADSGDRHYYHFDEMGNTLFRTDDAGDVSDHYAYSPYGTVQARTEASENRFEYQGQLGHIQEGDDLVYMRARWYDASAGRFLSRDPRNESLSPLETMPYSYARQNPLLYVDPKGTNVEVNAAGIHTDIKVDIWCGDQIIGTLFAGFWPKCVARGKPESLEGLKGITYGADSAIKGRFSFGRSVSPSLAGNTTGNVFVKGGRDQDERLAKQILKWMGWDEDGKTAGEILKERYPVPKGTKSKNFQFLVDANDTYGRYRLFTQVCNDFTDDALDTYYGYNWYLGSFHLGATLIDQVRDYESLREEGLPLGGFYYQELVPAIFGGF